MHQGTADVSKSCARREYTAGTGSALYRLAALWLTRPLVAPPLLMELIDSLAELL